MGINKIPEGEIVTLEDILAARDRRVGRIAEFQQKWNCCVVSFTLNIPGPVKRTGLSVKSFETGKKEILSALSRNNAEILDYIYIDEKTGTEAMWAINADALEIKKTMTNIEEHHFFGRLFDIDVIEKNGEKISRTEIGQEERGCFICGKAGAACARSRTHSIEELTGFTFSLMEEFFENQHIKYISKNAIKALLYEVCITPKPGLVDRANSGAHSDMDVFTFIDSACSLINYSENITRIAMKNRDVQPGDLLGKIRFEGIMAENVMFEATKGINTHKGLIFSLGIVCAAYGYLYESSNISVGYLYESSDMSGGYLYSGSNISTEKVLETCAAIAQPALANDFKNLDTSTNGEILYARHKIRGVRGEAASGFSSVRKYGLPVLESCLSDGLSLNDAGVITLLNLIANVEDTNIISRSNLETHAQIQENLKKLLAEKLDAKALINKAIDRDSEFIRQNISPGGCADLLAVTLMLHFSKGI